MSVVVLYDSIYGNTELIAQAIASSLGADADVRLLRVESATPDDAVKADMLVIGSPTHRWGPSQRMKEFLGRLPEKSLSGTRAATFDTIVKYFLPGLSGSAAKRIARTLERQDCKMVARPEQFVVKGNEGPLADGEYQRALEWGKQLAATLKHLNHSMDPSSAIG